MVENSNDNNVELSSNPLLLFDSAGNAGETGNIIDGETERTKRFAALYQNTISDFIKKPHVVIGCGAIGGYVIKVLGQIGIDNLTLWDDDIVETVNLGPQGFFEEYVDELKTEARGNEFYDLNSNGEIVLESTKFKKHHDHPPDAFWWMCVDTLDAREFIYKAIMDFEPFKIIDTRMGGLNYEIYAPAVEKLLPWTEDRYIKTIEDARDNLVQESCTTRSTPHTAMLAASIGINMALTKNPPFAIKGNMMTYKQDTTW